MQTVNFHFVSFPPRRLFQHRFSFFPSIFEFTTMLVTKTWQPLKPPALPNQTGCSRNLLDWELPQSHSSDGLTVPLSAPAGIFKQASSTAGILTSHRRTAHAGWRWFGFHTVLIQLLLVWSWSNCSARQVCKDTCRYLWPEHWVDRLVFINQSNLNASQYLTQCLHATPHPHCSSRTVTADEGWWLKTNDTTTGLRWPTSAQTLPL